MAETLANGTVVPQGSDLIHASGVQAMRNMGGSVDAQLGTKSDEGHTHPASAITGLADALAAATYAKGVLNTAVDVFTLPPGVHVVPNTAQVERTANLPEPVQGVIIVEGAPSGSPIKSVRFTPYQRDYEWENRTSTLGGAWRGWKKIAAPSEYAQPPITEPVDLDSVLTPGVHALPAPYPNGGFTNIPDGNNGPSILLVHTSQGQAWAAQEIIQYGDTPRRWWRVGRSYSQGLWNDWIELTAGGGGESFAKPRITEPIDLDTLKDPGTHDLSTPYPTGLTNIPDGNTTASKIVVYGSPNTTWAAQEVFQYGANPRRWWRISRSTSEWNPWIELTATSGGGDGGPVPTNALALGGREMRMQLFRDAYPLVSTGGKGAVVFRYDHGLTNFKDVLLPLHQQHGVKAYIAMNSRLWDISENNGASQAEASAWSNVEWGNHTADHTDKTGVADIHDNIVNGRIELEEQLGTTIHGFTMPGVTEHDRFDGLGFGYASGYSNSYAGSLALNHHAIVSGVVGSVHRPLDGQVRLGGRHYTWEAAAWADIKAQIDQAATDKTALTIMCHPRTMDLDGYWTPTLAEQVISYVRSLIDAGDLADISYYQSHHAQLAPLPAPAYRSGLRDVSSELMNGWTGTLFVEREGVNVYFRGQINGAEATSDIAWMLPAGFRPGFVQSAGGNTDYGTGWAITSTTTPTTRRISHYLHRFQIVGGNGGTGNAALWNINYSLRTRETAPTTPPGDPA